MEHINVHIFNTIDEAQDAIQLINNSLNLPTEDGSTLTYCNVMSYNNILYILADDITVNILGEFSVLQKEKENII